MRDSVVIHKSFYEASKDLEPEEFKKFWLSIYEYAFDGKEPEDISGVVKASFILAKPQIDTSSHYMDNLKQRSSAKYRKWRELVLDRDGHKCTRCGSTERLHVHHIKPFTEYPELQTDVNNGITLCDKCHRKEHRNGKK